jgi:hypothetical protein
MTEKRIFDGVAVILEAVDFVATVEENEWSRGRGICFSFLFYIYEESW